MTEGSEEQWARKTHPPKKREKIGKSLRGVKTVENQTHQKPPKRRRARMALFCISFLFSTGSSETTRKIVFSGAHQKSTSKTLIYQKSKNPSAAFSNMRFFWSENEASKPPYFRNVSWGCQKWGSIIHLWTAKNGVQLSTRKHIYIYICISIKVYAYIYYLYMSCLCCWHVSLARLPGLQHSP